MLNKFGNDGGSKSSTKERTLLIITRGSWGPIEAFHKFFSSSIVQFNLFGIHLVDWNMHEYKNREKGFLLMYIYNI